MYRISLGLLTINNLYMYRGCYPWTRLEGEVQKYRRGHIHHHGDWATNLFHTTRASFQPMRGILSHETTSGGAKWQ